MSIAVYVMGALYLLIGAFIARSAYRARGPVAQVLRHRARTVGELAPGPAETSGTLRAVGGPLRSLDGHAVVAIHTSLGASIEKGGKTRDSHGIAGVVESCAAELTDATGSCAIDLREALVLGRQFAASYKPDAFREAFPTYWVRLTEGISGGTVLSVHVEQTYLLDGATVFVSGTCAPAPPDEAADYRAPRPRFTLTSSDAAPMLASSFSEEGVRRTLRHPSLVLAWLALVLLSLGAATCALPTLLNKLAGL